MSSIPADSDLRGAAASFPQPVNAADMELIRQGMQAVHHYNCEAPPAEEGVPRLETIVYRSSANDLDVRTHLYRWDYTPYEEAFQRGFSRERPAGTNEATYFNIFLYVTRGGRPADPERADEPTRYGFVSTTNNANWHPYIADPEREIYRYEIYAPGGINVSQTLGPHYPYNSQSEFCFISGIAPQYIRSAQRFRLIHQRHSRFTRREIVDESPIINRNFNPQSHPSRILLIRYPTTLFNTADGQLRMRFRLYPPVEDEHEHDELRKREVEPINYYIDGVADENVYITSAFRSAAENEAYLFMGNEYVRVTYTPRTTNISGNVVKGPLLICSEFASLCGTPFGEDGIDCAFRCDSPGSTITEAFIFSGNLCAKWNATDDVIVEGPKTIAEMFPFFKGTEFEASCDAAFELAGLENQAYIFKGKYYAHIDYAQKRLKGSVRLITEGLNSLADTVFSSDIGAAFASHQLGAYYFFKDQYYTVVYFTPGANDDYLIDGVNKIGPHWPFLSKILPRKNCGLDVHQHPNPPPEQHQDEY